MIQPDQKKISGFTFFVPPYRGHTFRESNLRESRQRSFLLAEKASPLANRALPTTKQSEVFKRSFPQTSKKAKAISSGPLKKAPEPEILLKPFKATLDSERLCRSFLSFFSDDELLDLIDRVDIEEGDGLINNPLDFIGKRLWGNCDRAVQKMAMLYPVTDRHLILAISSRYAVETIRAMFEQAVCCQQYTGKGSLDSLIHLDYPDELVFLFSKQAANVEYPTFKLAQSREDLSEPTIGALRDKVSLEALLWHGEPEELILEVCEHAKEGTMCESCIQVANLRNYSGAVIEKIKTKCYFLELNWQSKNELSDLEFEG